MYLILLLWGSVHYSAHPGTGCDGTKFSGKKKKSIWSPHVEIEWDGTLLTLLFEMLDLHFQAKVL